MASQDDRTSVIIDPAQFTGLAAKRQAQVDAKRRLPIDVEGDAYRATCPWCHAPNVVMSPIANTHVMSTPPEPGDVLQCDACRRHHIVDQVNGFAVKTNPIDMDLTDVKL